MKHLAIVAVAAMGMTAYAQTTPAPGQGQGQGRANFAQRKLDRLAIMLDMNANQKAQAQAIFTNAEQQAQTLVQQLRTNQQALQNVITSGNTANLQTLANTQGSLVSQLTVIKTQAAAQFYKLLTPQQQQKVTELHGLGMGPGMMGHGMGGGVGFGAAGHEGGMMHHGPGGQLR